MTLESLEARETPTVSPGTITTIAVGGPPSVLVNPSAVAADAAGDVFIADSGTNRVFELNHTTGLLTSIAGNGSSGFSGDGGPAVSATLNSPQGLAVDSAGNLYIADENNEVIREVNHLTGVITTVAGVAPQGSSGGSGFGDGFGDGLSDGVGGGVPQGSSGGSGNNGGNIPALSATLNSPASVAVDAAGDIFIADFGNNLIREVNAATHVITTVAGNGGQGYNGDGIPGVSALT